MVYGKPNGTVWPGYVCQKLFPKMGPTSKHFCCSACAWKSDLGRLRFNIYYLPLCALLNTFKPFARYARITVSFICSSAESADHHRGNEGFWYTRV